MGSHFKTFFNQSDDWEKDDAFLEKFRKELRQNKYDCVLSLNFAPLISQVCEELGVRYVSWVYDSLIPELAEYFSVGEECVVYDNVEDLYIKAAYYLEHEEERKRIAQAGYERVKRDFTFKERLEKMLLK